MMCPVIHDVQQNLPKRLLIRLALQRSVRDLGRGMLIGHRRGPDLPTLLKGWPFLSELVELAIFRIDKRRPRIALYSRQPDSVGREYVDQGVEHAFVRSFEIA